MRRLRGVVVRRMAAGARQDGRCGGARAVVVQAGSRRHGEHLLVGRKRSAAKGVQSLGNGKHPLQLLVLRRLVMDALWAERQRLSEQGEEIGHLPRCS